MPGGFMAVQSTSYIFFDAALAFEAQGSAAHAGGLRLIRASAVRSYKARRMQINSMSPRARIPFMAIVHKRKRDI